MKKFFVPALGLAAALAFAPLANAAAPEQPKPVHHKHHKPVHHKHHKPVHHHHKKKTNK